VELLLQSQTAWIRLMNIINSYISVCVCQSYNYPPDNLSVRWVHKCSFSSLCHQHKLKQPCGHYCSLGKASCCSALCNALVSYGLRTVE